MGIKLRGWMASLWLSGNSRGIYSRGIKHSRFIKSLNATFLALISKKGGTEELKDFRPISLAGVAVQVAY